jgi:hypothetical protein
MTACPSCGSTNLGDASCLDCAAPLDAEARIAAWLDAPRDAPPPVPRLPSPTCTACGYEGEMVVDDRGGTTCPACLVVVPARRTEATVKVMRVVECPGCGRSIGVAKEDERKTVICPGCSYFLGTIDVAPSRRGA